MSQQLRDQLQATLSGTHTLGTELGGGGMSRVFVAEELRLRRKVVVKVLSPELAQGLSVERFEREIQTMAALQQANIVGVLSAGETNGLPFYTMPFVEGESLRARLARGPLPVADVIGILRDLTRALGYAHEHGVAHRDIKPDNVLMSGGAAMVTDFGIAKAISAARTASGGATLTQIGTSIGTPAYMAPEQAAGDPAVDHRVDIYSLGAMAYELLAGQVVFADRTPQRMLAAHMGETPRPLTDFRGDVPASLAALIMACLAKLPDDRPQTIAEIARALDTITSGAGMGAMPPILVGGPGMLRKALAVYAGAFVAVAILAKAAIVGIGLPDWVFPGSLIVMALGLPVVLWTGYVHRVARRAATMTPTFTPGGTPSTTVHGAVATLALKVAPRMSWYRTSRGMAWALGAFVVVVAAFMAMRVFGIGPAATLFGSGQLKERDPIVMTHFAVTSGDTSLARVVSFAVRNALTQSRVLSIMDEATVASALERMDRPRTARVDLALAQGIALREGANAIVDGEVTTVGSGYVLTVRLVTADSGRLLASFQSSGDGPKGLIEAADRVARDLRAKAGESLRSVQKAVPLTRARTASLEALRRYHEGTIANDIEANYSRAVRLLRQAVTLDTSFAEGWRKLGVAMGNGGLSRAQADSAIARAYRLRDRLSEGEREMIVSSYYYNGPGRDRAMAIAAFEKALEHSATRNGNNLGLMLASRREFARAESLYRASITTYPNFQLSYNNLAITLTDQGKLDAADSVVGLHLRRFPNSETPRINAALLLYFRGRLEEYGHRLDSARAVRDPYARAWAFRASAAFSLLRGQPGRWRAHRDQALSVDSARGVQGDGPLTRARALAIEVATRGASGSRLEALEAALERAPMRTLPDAERPDLQVAYYVALAGQPGLARRIVSDFQSTVRDTALRRDLEPDLQTALGMIALAERNPAQAIVHFRRGDLRPDGPASICTICLPLNLGRAFDAANQPDSAIVEYERYIATPYAQRWTEQFDPVALPAIHERLGQLYEAAGSTAKAAEHYRAFIELWKNADAELQPRVTDARRRLERLTPVERRQ